MDRRHKIALGVLVAFLLLCAGARALMGGGDSPAEQQPISSTAADAAAGGSATGSSSALVGAASQGLVEGLPGGGAGSVPTPDGGSTGPNGVASAAAEDAGGLESLLPYLTEGTFFALIGFALGYASKKVVKVGLIFIAIFFAGLQGMVYAGVADVDWGAAIDLLNNLILNIQEDQTFTEILKAKIPTAGGLTAGYLLGFRRG